MVTRPPAQTKNKTDLFRIVLAGNPNSGKSSLFNALTGLNQKIGNYPGVTIDKRTGRITIPDSSEPGKNIHAEIIDLPGLYGLAPGSEDETIAYRILTDTTGQLFSGLAIVIIDASKLKRSLFLCTELLDRKLKVIIALNMMDVADMKGISIDIPKLSALLHVPVIPVNAKKQTGIHELISAIGKQYFRDTGSFPPPVEPGAGNGTESKTIHRYRMINEIIDDCVMLKPKSPQWWSVALDTIFMHKIWGYVIFLAIMFLMFQAIFSWATYPMNFIDFAFLKLRIFTEHILPQGVLSSLITDGIIPGIGGIVMFIPQIAILFFFISLLEDSGYLTRVTFIMDKIMRKFGLNGRSVIPLVSSAACAIPAIMSTRIINNRKERLLSIFIIPLISCSARLPVYILIVSLIISPDDKLWIFNLQGLTLMGIYLSGLVVALLTAFVFKFIIRTREPSYFIMELPEYNIPQWRSVGLIILEKIKVFTYQAGKIIMAISIILWVLASYSPGDNFKKIEQKYSDPALTKGISPDEISTRIQSEKLAASYAGILGRQLEPVIKPLGFDWKTGIAIITSFAAREVFVGTMATIYSVGDKNQTQTIRERMAAEINPETGNKQYGLAACVSLLIYFAFALQCMSTIAVVYRETRHWKWPLIQLVYLTGLAYILSFIAFRILS